MNTNYTRPGFTGIKYDSSLNSLSERSTSVLKETLPRLERWEKKLKARGINLNLKINTHIKSVNLKDNSLIDRIDITAKREGLDRISDIVRGRGGRRKMVGQSYIWKEITSKKDLSKAVRKAIHELIDNLRKENRIK